MIPKSLLEHLSRTLDEELGLCFPMPKWGDLERGIQSAALELGFESTIECAEWLASGRITKPQLELLAGHLTIGETYFFRDPAVFELLEKKVLPGLIHARRNAGRQLRIWSAACCTGEEPYSIAIALKRLLPDIADWHITILATDVNPRFLKKAGAGRYTGWSFRGTPDPTLREHFHEGPEGTREIALPTRKMVSFATLNLAGDAYPSLITNTNAMDVIFCRNALMYFSPNQAAKVAARFHQCLTDGGWLFTSPTEVSMDVFRQFATERASGVVAFRKQARPSEPARAPHPAPAIPAPRPAARPAPAPKAATATDAPAGTPDQSEKLGLARRLANEGRLSDALAECETVIAGDKLYAVGHYLRGMILQENAAYAEAKVALRRALFLNPNLIVAHFALGNLMRQTGRRADADRSFENARSLLQKLAPDAEVPESDGITSGRLLAMVESIQDIQV